MTVTGNAAQFAVDLSRDYRRLEQKDWPNFKHKVVFVGQDYVVVASPVDRGTLRQNWHVTGGDPDEWMDEGLTGGSKGDKPDVRQEMQADEALRSADLFATVYIQNNLPYAEAIENGHSKQAPEGMVAGALVAMASIKVKA